jgi:hypothetical protein
VRAAVDAAVEPTRSDAAETLAKTDGPVAVPALADEADTTSLQAAAERWASLLQRQPGGGGDHLAFRDFTEHCRWLWRHEFVRWVDASEDLHARLLAAVGAHASKHAIERAWERLRLGPMQLESCLDSLYRVMETMRLRFIVVGLGVVDVSRDGSTVLHCSEQGDARVRHDAEHVDLAAEVATNAVCAIEAAAKASGSATLDSYGNWRFEQRPERNVSVPRDIAIAVASALRAGTARAITSRTLKVITNAGTLIVDMQCKTLITIIPDNGRWKHWLEVAEHIQRDPTWRMPEVGHWIWSELEKVAEQPRRRRLLEAAGSICQAMRCRALE